MWLHLSLQLYCLYVELVSSWKASVRINNSPSFLTLEQKKVSETTTHAIQLKHFHSYWSPGLRFPVLYAFLSNLLIFLHQLNKDNFFAIKHTHFHRICIYFKCYEVLCMTISIACFLTPLSWTELPTNNSTQMTSWLISCSKIAILVQICSFPKNVNHLFLTSIPPQLCRSQYIDLAFDAHTSLVQDRSLFRQMQKKQCRYAPNKMQSVW